jgi:type 1 glutamine amidotransferase
MKRSLLTWLACIVLAETAVQAASTESVSKLRILLIYGGHGFETNQFFQVFRENPDITLATAEYPQAQAMFKPSAAGGYDVLVFYDMWKDLSAEAKSDLVALIKGGKPLLALHHTLGAFQQWDEYANIIGGRYHITKWGDHGVEKPESTYKHDVDFQVHIVDPNHPVTRGLKDFAIHDETYGGLEIRPGSKILLTTEEPTASHALGWAKTYGAARVVYLQLGHDHQAYDNPNYQQLVRQAIRWVAKR